MSKEYDVPQEVEDLFAEGAAMEGLRDRYIKMPFCFKKTKKCAIKAEIKNRLVWRMFCDIFPELRGKRLSYNAGKVTEIEK